MSGEVAETADWNTRRSLKARENVAYLEAAHLVMDELQRDKRNPVHYSRLAMIHNALGQRAMARKLVLMGLSVCPYDPSLRQLSTIYGF